MFIASYTVRAPLIQREYSFRRASQSLQSLIDKVHDFVFDAISETSSYLVSVSYISGDSGTVIKTRKYYAIYDVENNAVFERGDETR